MRTFGISRPRASMVVAFVALVAALSGSAAALPGKNKVDSGDIANGQVKRPDINNSAVNSAKVKDGSLKADDFAPGQLPAGAKGDKGDRGDRGAPGAPGSALAFARVRADGTLHAANSKNIALSQETAGGVYCLVVPPGARSMMATVDTSYALGTGVASPSLDPTTVAQVCRPPANAVVTVLVGSGNGYTYAARDIMVLVN